eukprot:TRINITY_DN6484_c0_g1_i1.p1 TRINITY_DN6484_c0_g1~~TRINITY_DN6484_c0_g1_i1.p1  ORF type:complete len:389 (-),score=40.24 TRINITY_DN6484_c0_g1_i1:279-1337(-)
MAVFTELPLWFRGGLVCLCGCTFTALGIVLQKLSHNLHAVNSHADQDGKRRQSRAMSYLMQPWWIFGFVIFTAGQILNVAAMSLAPQLLLTCLGPLTLAVNTYFARIILGEPVSWGQLIAIVGIVVSTWFAILSAPRLPRESMGTDGNELIERLVSLEYIILTGIFVAIICLTRTVAVGCSRRSGNEKRFGDNSVIGVDKTSGTLTSVFWAVVAAVGGGYSIAFWRCFVEILVGAANPWRSWEMYFFGVTALTVAPIELHLVNIVLKTGTGTCAVPTYLALAMVCQIIQGCVLLQEWKYFLSWYHAMSFGFCVVLVIAFVVALVNAQNAVSKKIVPEMHKDPLVQPFFPNVS